MNKEIGTLYTWFIRRKYNFYYSGNDLYYSPPYYNSNGKIKGWDHYELLMGILKNGVKDVR